MFRYEHTVSSRDMSSIDIHRTTIFLMWSDRQYEERSEQWRGLHHDVFAGVLYWRAAGGFSVHSFVKLMIIAEEIFRKRHFVFSGGDYQL